MIWGMLNDLSVIMSLTMVSITIPGIAQPFMSIVLQFIQLDLLQTDQWLTPIFYMNEDEDESLSEYLEEQGYQSMFIINNLGSTLVFSLILTALFFCFPAIARLGKCYATMQALNKYLQRILFWNSSIRFIIQQFQPLLISAIINLYYVSSQSQPIYSQNFNHSLRGSAPCTHQPLWFTQLYLYRK
ncbi:hypothetical protein FGO68_gene10973 [Halteria grandinella]|uniref:Uncharacterized protein n=1 Tax=Halteria grandinella TaxID=5974 RepID=A0A8J8P0P2_HALGN|nr:hypothetical protein FGO68_gene10973 [Halteria grandinella]